MVAEETNLHAARGSSSDPAVPLCPGRGFVPGLRQAPAAAQAAGPPTHPRHRMLTARLSALLAAPRLPRLRHALLHGRLPRKDPG